MPGATPGRRVSGSMPRLTHFRWSEVTIGPLRNVTPQDGETVRNLTPAEHVRESLGIPAAQRRGDERPTLVYWHWPHEDERWGKLSDTLCGRILNDEQVARWGMLYRCVQVDMGASDVPMLKRAGAPEEPGFALIDADGKIVVRIEAEKSSVKLAKALEDGLARFAAYRKAVEKRLKEQERDLDEAKRLDKAGELEEALKLVDAIRFGDLRIGKCYEAAWSYGQTLAQRVENAKEDAKR